jgi:hypothetical protein
MPVQLEFDEDDPNRPDRSPPDEEEFEEDPPPPRRCDRGDMIRWRLWFGVAQAKRRSLARQSKLENTSDDGQLSTARPAVFILVHDHDGG